MHDRPSFRLFGFKNPLGLCKMFYFQNTSVGMDLEFGF